MKTTRKCLITLLAIPALALARSTADGSGRAVDLTGVDRRGADMHSAELRGATLARAPGAGLDR